MSDFQADYFEDFESMADREDFEEDDFEASDIVNQSDAFSLAELILGFIESTPELTEPEQAELLGAFVEDTRRSGEFDWGKFSQGVQTGLNLFQTGAQIAGGIAGAVGGNSRTARDISLWSRRLGQGAGYAQNLMRNIRPGQVPRLPTGVQRVAQVGRSYLRRPVTRTAPTGRQPPGRTRAVAPTRAPGRSPLNNTAQFASLLNNPQILQALRSALFRGREGTLRIEANISDSIPAKIPLADVVDTIARLAQESALELNALAGDDSAEIPDYLVSEDGEYIVDQECAEDRQSVVLGLLRLQGELDRYDELGGWVEAEGMAGNVLDESEVWAREAGFDI